MSGSVAFESALEIDDVSVAYDAGPVIRNVNLSIRRGETFGLMGLNGAGKTTLIKVVLGLRDRYDGSIKVSGYSPQAKESKKHIAYLPERFDPPSFLTGSEFLGFSVRLYGHAYDSQKVKGMADSLALSQDALNRRIGTYSKGMRQKLGLMATLLTDCSLMILDEPMSGLDPMARALVKDTLGEVRKTGRTIFLSSHILADMGEICDHVAVLHDKDIVFDGSPEAMLKVSNKKSMEQAFLSMIEAGKAA